MQTPGFRVFASNYLEVLAEKLASEILTPLASPLEKDIIVVQSQGMARWISMELARINGICANCSFPFPNSFLNGLFDNLLPEFPETILFDPEVLTFRIMKLLPGFVSRPGFEKVGSYLFRDDQHVKLFQLSEKIAHLFDQYMVFRPWLILAWEESGKSHENNQEWQADLWREIVGGNSLRHRTYLHKILLENMINNTVNAGLLPQRISVFGISHLPPFHLQVLDAMSRHVQVNLFLMSPCKEYWGEIVTDREVRHIKRRYEAKGVVPKQLHLEKGNRLLSSMGVLGRDFMSMVSELECSVKETYVTADRKTMLSAIQNDILNLVDTTSASNTSASGVTCASPQSDDLLHESGDGSIQIHACHGPMRELEILYDHLLAMLDEDRTLLPKDILVMIPDLETYAPFIYAVFDVPADENLKIPFSVADKSMIRESRVIEGFMSILDLATTRLEAAGVLSLLEYPSIKEKIGLNDQDIALIETWVRDVNIRWGIDAESRKELGLPAFPENTWRAGIERMLLGYAMRSKDLNMFSGILPYDNIEGGDSQHLGKLLAFLDTLFGFVDRFKQPKTLNGWAEVFLAAMEKLLAVSGYFERESLVLRQAIERLSEIETVSGFDDTLAFEVIRTYLRNLFKKRTAGAGFISGGVTFCAMLPMRSIPFRVICMVGMNADDFPRDAGRLSFDILATHPIKGDRSLRNDDKYLFLESIISAREKLYISYIGQSIQDNSRILPSVLVSELGDYIHERFGIDRECLIKHHPLQAFSREYFKKSSPFFSYSKENFSAVAHPGKRKGKHAFIAKGLTSPAEAWKRLDVEMLSIFFSNPARFLLQERLGIRFEKRRTFPEDRENFRLAPLDRYTSEQELIHYHQQGLPLENLAFVLKAKGILPHGEVGTHEFNQMVQKITIYIEQLGKYTRGIQPDEMAVEITIDQFSLSGSLPHMYSGNLMIHRYAKKNPRDMLRAWIYHLVLCSALGREHCQESRYLCKDTLVVFDPVDDSDEMLAYLLKRFWEGLKMPLHFFPITSYVYARRLGKHSKNHKAALKAAQERWINEYGWSESDDPYFSQCFGDVDPLDARFQSISEGVFGPILAHSREKKIV